MYGSEWNALAGFKIKLYGPNYYKDDSSEARMCWNSW